MITSTEAQRLKDQGNALFVKEKYKEAMEKYTAAIGKDEGNAVLYSNRAACALNLNKYNTAAEDAEKATQLDPSYTKAWVRLGTAEHHLGHWEGSIRAWDGALSSLPTVGLSTEQEKQKIEAEEHIRDAKAAAAVMYSDRAAYALSAKKYSQAADDAEKATNLNPSYTNAWIHLGTAEHHLGRWEECNNAWEGALASLPELEISSELSRKRDEFYDGIAKAKADEMHEHSKDRARPTLCKVGPGNTPVERMLAMIPQLERKGETGKPSSAWKLHGAHHELSLGLEYLAEPNAYDGTYSYASNTKALEHFTNALARDDRPFHGLSKQTAKKMAAQTTFESTLHNAWTRGSPNTILKEAKERLLSSSWDDVCAAMTTTIRGLIMRAWRTAFHLKNQGAAIAIFSDAVSIIEAGRALAANVPEESRGAVFSRTFVRGIKSLHLDTYTWAMLLHPEEFTVKGYQAIAQDLLDDVQSDPPTGGLHPGFLLSFWSYPESKAIAALASCDIMANLASKDSWMRAGELLIKASDILPDDEERKCIDIAEALFSFWTAGAPLKVTLPLMKELRVRLPKSKALWEYSMFAISEGSRIDDRVPVGFEDKVKRGLANGTFTLDSVVVPEKYF